MQILADAHNSGKISDTQLIEGIQTSLGTLPEVADRVKEGFLDLSVVANDAARNMSSTFVDYLFDPMEKSIGDMLLSFLKATAKMIAQAAMLQLVKTGMNAMGFSMSMGAATFANRPNATADAIELFLGTANAIASFVWQPPHGLTGT